MPELTAAANYLVLHTAPLLVPHSPLQMRRLLSLPCCATCHVTQVGMYKCNLEQGQLTCQSGLVLPRALP